MADPPKFRAIEMPRNIVTGNGAIECIKDMCQDLHLEGPGTIITGGRTAEAAGNRVRDLMDGCDVDVCVTGEATFENARIVSEATREHGSRFMLAVGGGNKIDLAKVVANELRIPFVAVPTSASHDGIASNRASLKSPEGSRSMASASPLGVVADTEVISKAPYRLLASGCADVVSNLTALMDWDLARRLKGETFSRSAYALSMYAADYIMENSGVIKPGMEESVKVAIKPIIISGVSMSLAGSSRPTSGAEHMFSHTLDLRCPGKALHGEQCGVGSILTMYLHGGNWESIRDALAEIGAPVTARQLGIPADEIVYALSHAHEIRSDRFTILGEGGVSEDVARSVAEATGVIRCR